MSSPGFTGGGASEFFAGAGGLAGRSMAAAAAATTTMNNPATAPSATTNNHLHPSHHPLYRTQQQLPSIFLDPSSQIPQRQTPTLIGKRTLAEFQTHLSLNQNHNHNHKFNHSPNQILSNFLLRSVKPRTSFQHTSPLSPMSPMDFSIPELHNPSGFQTQRFGVPLLHQLRPQPINLPNNNNNGTLSTMTNSILPNPNFPYRNSNLGQAQNRIQTPEPEKNIMDHRLQELEKQLLEDNDEEGEADAASVITSSEWTIQNLMGPGPTQKPASSSPTSSTTSSTSSSSSVASPASGCSKQTLMEAASAISEGRNDAAAEILARLAQGPNPTGNSDQRLTDCMVSALKSRMNPFENPPPVGELFSREHAESTQLLFEHSICFKVGFTAANLAILEAAFEEKTENRYRFCVVDFDIGNGKQYVSLLHALSARGQNGRSPATVKIVAVAENGGDERLRAVDEMLSLQAERLRIGFGFEFKVVVVTQKLAELSRESLGCDPDELLAVNFGFKLNRIPDESVSTENPRDELLRRVKKLAPRVVTILEQEMNTNTAPFLARVAESCSYYGALFDSIESTMARDNSVPHSERVRVEEGLSRKLCNSVACEGRDRVERCEVFGKWRARMSMAGFQLKPLSQGVAESIKSRLVMGNNRVSPGLTVKEENGGICFGWMGRTLTVASAWR